MRIAGLPPVMQQGLLTAIATAAKDVATASAASEGPPPTVASPAMQSATHPHTSVEMLVAIAAAEPGLERRRKLAAKTDKGLSLLERLDAELLAGPLPPERVEELVEWSESFELPEDPALAEIAREIELRVRVEIAKHELRA
ncbi:flagellar assembly protein FliX [Sphingomonas sp. ac-8]|uniref:flagellar assembly protein FliX n=1 Tax=Sphingomonas sp. ac-8 TaxID=3242977 RepID=UPI003A7FB982